MGAGAGGYVTITLQTLLSKFGERPGIFIASASCPSRRAHPRLSATVSGATSPSRSRRRPPAARQVGSGEARCGHVQPVPRLTPPLLGVQKNAAVTEDWRTRSAAPGPALPWPRPHGRPLQLRGRYHPQVPDQAEGEEAVPGHADRHGLRHRPLRRPLSSVRDRGAGDRREGRHQRQPSHSNDEVHHEPASTRRPCRDHGRAGLPAARLRDDPEARRRSPDVELCRDASAAVLVGRARGVGGARGRAPREPSGASRSSTPASCPARRTWRMSPRASAHVRDQ